MQKVVWTETRVTGGTIDIALATPETNRDFYRDIVVLAFPTPADDSYRLADISYKAGYKTIDRGRMPERGVPPLPIDPEPAGPARTIDPTSIVDISDHFIDGRLRWQAPRGHWTVMRIGHTSTGVDNHPVSASGQGLECDKLSRQAIKVHMNAFMRWASTCPLKATMRILPSRFAMAPRRTFRRPSSGTAMISSRVSTRS